jgi:hypothetical protein
MIFYEFLNFEFRDVTNFFLKTSVFGFSGARITIMKVKIGIFKTTHYSNVNWLIFSFKRACRDVTI